MLGQLSDNQNGGLQTIFRANFPRSRPVFKAVLNGNKFHLFNFEAAERLSVKRRWLTVVAAVVVVVVVIVGDATGTAVVRFNYWVSLKTHSWIYLDGV